MTYILLFTERPYRSSSGTGNGAPLTQRSVGSCARTRACVPRAATIIARASVPTEKIRVFISLPPLIRPARCARNFHHAVIGSSRRHLIRQAAVLHLAADVVKLVADERHRIAVNGARQRRQPLPRVRRRVVGLERPERRHHLARNPLAAADVDLSVICGITAAAACRRHALLHVAPRV